MRTLRPLAFLFFLLALLALTACSQQLDFSLYADKSWRMQDDLKIDKDLLENLAPIGEQFGFDLPEMDSDALLSAGLEELTQTYQQQGLQASWQKREQRYTLTVSGKSYEQAGSLLPGLSIEPLAGAANQYHLRAGLQGLPGEMNLFSGLFDTVIRIHVGRIISCNDCQRQGNTAIWHNPLQIDLVFSPALPPFWLYLLLGLALLIALIVLAALARSASRKTCPSCGAQIPRRAEYCPYCGGMNV
ncbi:MAG: hypothetical protein OHK0031_01030 [Anaerolineales bacterium]